MLFTFFSFWWEKCPRAIEENICCELLLILVGSNTSSMDSDDVSYSLGDWKVFEFVGEHYQCTVLDAAITFLVDWATWISNFH